ncbi:RNA polymerase sigma factor [Kitasatospora sp. NPDC050543]|uniref:RNA polymerase sigma factor n=1 Tax=Kitasatospora sp. NPDC050543 TaxID=3364054 RepID=UPI0037A70C90
MTTPNPGDSQGLQSDPIDALRVDFAAFFTSEHPGWLRYAQQRLRHRPDAEDAVQNAGVTLYRKWDRALRSADIKAFAFKVVKDAVTDTLRERVRTEDKARKLAAQPESPDTGRAELDRLDDRDAVDRAMAQLAEISPIQAEIVRMRQAGLKYPQIGEALGIAHTTARTYYSLGWRALQYLLDLSTHQEGNS